MLVPFRLLELVERQRHHEHMDASSSLVHRQHGTCVADTLQDEDLVYKTQRIEGLQVCSPCESMAIRHTRHLVASSSHRHLVNN
ncbi:hypothetical protein D9M69_595330 [compost metagenome]